MGAGLSDTIKQATTTAAAGANTTTGLNITEVAEIGGAGVLFLISGFLVVKFLKK